MWTKTWPKIYFTCTLQKNVSFVFPLKLGWLFEMPYWSMLHIKNKRIFFYPNRDHVSLIIRDLNRIQKLIMTYQQQVKRLFCCIHVISTCNIEMFVYISHINYNYNYIHSFYCNIFPSTEHDSFTISYGNSLLINSSIETNRTDIYTPRSSIGWIL